MSDQPALAVLVDKPLTERVEEGGKGLPMAPWQDSTDRLILLEKKEAH